MTQRHYSIKEAAALTGLPASTLRYYESVGVISPIGRGESSGHRVYDEAALDQLLAVACLAALGMSVKDMRDYIANVELGRPGAVKQVELLSAQQRRLEIEAEHMVLRQRYVRVKVAFWKAVEAGDHARRDELEREARSLMEELKKVGKP
jgi:DNA-binding transcriptional MerR regulator